MVEIEMKEAVAINAVENLLLMFLFSIRCWMPDSTNRLSSVRFQSKFSDQTAGIRIVMWLLRGLSTIFATLSNVASWPDSAGRSPIGLRLAQPDPKRPVGLVEARCPLPKVGPSYEGSPGGLGGRRVVADLRRNDPR